MELRLARLGLAAALLAALANGSAAASGAAGPKPPAVKRISCVDGCAGVYRAAAGSTVHWSGRHLAHVKTVSFPGSGGRIDVAPRDASRRAVKARVPAGATSGRPGLLTKSGARAHALHPLSIVPARRLPSPRALDLLHSRVRPRTAFFDRSRVRIHYRFRARSRSTVKIKLVRRSTGSVVARLTKRGVTPYVRHAASWRGLRPNGRVAPPGRYEVQIGRPGSHGHAGGRFDFFDGEFPVRGPHDYGGPVQRFGAPRSGGRVHQGQDVFAPCGTREVAARGGRVQAEGYDPVLYGYWLVIDTRRSRTDERYVHLEAPTPLHTGERVRTGQTVGRVGRTGNAESVGCMLHFEEWPSGWLHGNPVDPLPDLLRWDGWS